MSPPPALARLSVFFVALPLLAGCNSGSGFNSGGLRVVAAESVYGDVASQVGGSRVQVISLLSDPNADPHEYEPTTRDAIEIGQAQLVIVNGAGYDAFVDHLLIAAPNGSRRVLRIASLLQVPSGGNPHVWYLPTGLSRIAAGVASALQAIDPADSSSFAQGTRTFDARLGPLTSTLAETRSHYGGTTVLPTEQVADYLLEAAGLKAVNGPFQRAVEEGFDPPASVVAAFEGMLASHRARLLVVNVQTPSRLTDRMIAVARAAGVPTVRVTETLPAGLHVQDWMEETALSVEEALSASPP